MKHCLFPSVHLLCRCLMMGIFLPGFWVLPAQSPILTTLPEKQGFPFVISSVDLDSPVSAAWLNDHAAGSRGPVTAGSDGHLYVDGRRQRFVGLNCTWIPPKDQAAELADRLAFLGINIIRFHHIDANWGQSLLSSTSGKAKAMLDPAVLDRLDYFISMLQARGVYINLNLLTGREFSSADGLNPAVNSLTEFKSRHALGFWMPAALDLQKDYARQLLTHKNPYTGKIYAQDPGVAAVEINNENGLIMSWMSGWMEDIAPALTGDLKAGWNRWLKAKYPEDKDFSHAMDLVQPLGSEILPVLVEDGRPAYWNLEQHEGAAARLTALANRDGVRLEVIRKGSEGWHVQFNCGGLDLAQGGRYTLCFSARSPAGSGIRKLNVSFGMAHAPWSGLGFERTVDLGPDWQDFRMVIPSLALGDANARLNFSGLGIQTGALELAQVSLRSGGTVTGANDSVAKGTVSLPLVSRRGEIPPKLLEEWLDYLYALESEYWSGMALYLKQDLGLKALLTGTIVGCSTPGLMNQFDFVDAHAYWNHPAFPGTAWDARNNYVANRSLARDAQGGTLAELALRRIAGKPFSVSEYDHPHPNQYGMEMYLMLAAYACFQDWDMIYGFAMDAESSGGPLGIASFFDQLGNPIKAAAMPFAARLFRQGLISPGPRLVCLADSVQAEKDALPAAQAWRLFDASTLGMEPSMAMKYRVALSLPPEKAQLSLDALREEGRQVLSEVPVRSAGDFEGGQIKWNPQAGSFSAVGPSVLAAVRVADTALEGGDGLLPGDVDSPANRRWAPFGIDNPGWGLGFWNSQNAAALMVAPARAPVLAPNGKEKGDLVVFSGRNSGNTGERLREYQALHNQDKGSLRDPYSLYRIGPVSRASKSKSWALSARWDVTGLGGRILQVLDSQGRIKGKSPRPVLMPEDFSLWYVIPRNP